MTFRGAIAIPAALVVALTVVGAWIDGSSSSSARSPGATASAAASTTTAVAATPPPAAGTTTPPTGSGGGGTACTSVVHIGDSTSVGLMSPDFISDPALRVDAQYARVGVTDFRDEISGARSIVERYQGQENADDVATREVATGFDGCWVMALGTTDAANMHAGGVLTAGERIDRMLAIVGDDPVLWVTVKTLNPADPNWANPQMAAWNEALVAAQARHPNLQVYDWASVVQDAWFQDDGIHYTSAGNVERARLIADALQGAYPA